MKRSKNAKSAARSSASRGAADASGVAARAAEAFDLLGVPNGREPIVVACSGGADSAAALLLTRHARPHARLIACYVDHGVRPRASIAADRRAVRAHARVARAAARFVRLAEDAPHGASTEAALRTARYRALARAARSVGARLVVTGHQRDDVAESTLLALVRGTGIDGIAAMRPRRRLADGIDLVRPLLWASKAALEEYVGGVGLDVSEDETNADPRFRRNAVRAMLRSLENAARGSTRAIARSAAIAVEDKALLDAVTESAWTRCSAPDGRGLSSAELRKLPASLLHRVLRFECKRLAGTVRDFTYEHCVAIARAVKERRGGAFHAGRVRFELSGGRVRAYAHRIGADDDGADAPRDDRAAATAIVVPARARARRVRWDGGWVELRSTTNGAAFKTPPARDGLLRLDAGALAPGMTLALRRPANGDRFVPAGRRSSVSVARFLAKAGIARSDRGHVPLLCRGDAIVAVLGVRAAAPFAARPGGPALTVRWAVKPAPASARARR